MLGVHHLVFVAHKAAQSSQSAEQNQRDGEDKKMEHYVNDGKLETKSLAKFFRKKQY